METILNKIAAFADDAHGDQQRKYADERYIEHPLRVMNICKKYGYPLPVLAAAILHDVLEDTNTTAGEINEFLLTVMNKREAAHTIALVTELTDIYTKNNYPRLNRQERKAKEANRLAMISAEGQTIKYADIIDNAKGIASENTDFGPVFLKECKVLLDKMNNGNKELHSEAVAVIENEMDQLRSIDQHS